MGSIQEQWLGEPLWGHMVGGNGQSCASPKKKKKPHKQIGNKGAGLPQWVPKQGEGGEGVGLHGGTGGSLYPLVNRSKPYRAPEAAPSQEGLHQSRSRGSPHPSAWLGALQHPGRGKMHRDFDFLGLE